MNKYILYRNGIYEEDEDDGEDREVEELVAVECGQALDDVLEDILRDIRDDLTSMAEYAKCSADAYGPIDENYDKAPFNFMGVVIPPVAEKNILIDYTVEVEEQ